MSMASTQKQHNKALMMATVPSMIGQFNMANIQILLDLGYEVHVACNFDDRSVWTEDRVEEFKKQLDDLGVKYYQIDFARSPKHIGMVTKSYRQIKALLFKEKYTLMHVHTPVAAAEGRLAAKDYNDAIERRIKECKSAPDRLRVIYTAHGFHFYDGAPLKNWLLFYPVEKELSRITDVLITINKEDYKRAKNNFYAKNTVYVPGVGVDVKKFADVRTSIDRNAKRRELKVKSSDILLLSVGELNENKNNSVVIKAIGELQRTDKIKDNHIVYMIAGTGDKKEYLEKLAADENVDLRLLGFRNDVSELLTAADLYILPSICDGLNVSLLEAMASKTPCLAGYIRESADFNDIGNSVELFDPGSYQSVEKMLEIEINHKNEWQNQGQYNYNKIDNFNISVLKEDCRNLVVRGKKTYVFALEYGLDLEDYRYLNEIIHRQNKRLELGLKKDDFVIISVGELTDRKNQILVLKALVNIKKDNPKVFNKIKYVIVGIGSNNDKYKDFICKNELDDNVKLIGYRTDIPELLHASDLFVFPSRQEGLPVALMEAISSGINVICSKIRGNTDLEKDMLFDPDDVDELERLICKNTNSTLQNSDQINFFSMNNVNRMMKEIYQAYL